MIPFDSWAEHFETVMERTFGEVYHRLTDCALAEIEQRAAPGAAIIDFGAGSGRLSIPLAAKGYRVTAVDPSGPMLEQLRHRCSTAGVQTAQGVDLGDPPHHGIRTVCSTMQAYPGRARHQLALCVFTVIAYLLDESELDAGIAAAASALAPGGLFLLDVPHPDVFTGLEYEDAHVIRSVDIRPAGGGLHAYRERTTVRTEAGQTSYSDDFVIREWEVHDVRAALERRGFRPESDVAPRFAELGADYLLVRAPD